MYTHRISICILAPALAVALSLPVSAQVSSAPYRAEGGAVLFGSTGNQGATFITIDPLTGAATPIGPHGAFGPVADIACSPSGIIFGGTGGGLGNLITIDPAGPTEALVGPNGLGLSANIGLAWAGSTLYCTVIFLGGGGSPSDLVTLNPNTGFAQTVGPTGLGPIGGLAYDKFNDIMYGVESGGQSQGRLVTINLSTGAAAIVGPTGFLDVAALEFDPTTGALFAGIGGGDPAAGSLILIDTATGTGTLVGSTGFPALSGITFCGEAPLGACCDPLAEVCTDDIELSDCQSADGVWSVGQSCAQVPCPPPLLEGCGGVNESFETGSFSGWVTQDLSIPFFPLQVGGAGISPGFGFFFSAPTDGSFAALHGFDGWGPGTIVIAEDVNLPVGVESLEFNYRAAWDLQTFGATVDRIFEVTIRPTGGGPPLQGPELILTARAGTIQPDTGDLIGSVDVSAFSGQAVRLSFEWFVPQFFSGPAFFQLDDIGCTIEPFCGDGNIDPGEECDNGPDVATDCCDANCMFESAPGAFVCRPAVDVCDVDEVCPGATAVCPADEFAAVDTFCEADTRECYLDKTCDGMGACIENVDAGANCGGLGSAPTQCSDQDTCDATGACQPNHFAPGTDCGPGETECSNQDTCDGTGACANVNHKADGTLCGDPADDCKDQDRCLGGACGAAPFLACGPTDGCCPPTGGAHPGPACGPRDHDLDCGDPVPTVSTWGLVILAMLFLVAMKVHFGRRRTVGQAMDGQ